MLYNIDQIVSSDDWAGDEEPGKYTPPTIGNSVMSALIFDRPANLILRSLAADDYARIGPYLVNIDLKLRQPLIRPAQKITHVYFLNAGLASVVATTAAGNQAEVGMVGYEGLTDVGAINNADSTPLETFIQIPGDAHMLARDALDAALDASETLRETLRNYAQSFLVQVAHTALANASHTIEQRLARWLLMSQDRVGDDRIVMTHEFLSIMLGVRRAGVTLALQEIERLGAISPRRGSITILDRARLRVLAGEGYGTPEAEYARLMRFDFRRASPTPEAFEIRRS